MQYKHASILLLSVCLHWLNKSKAGVTFTTLSEKTYKVITGMVPFKRVQICTFEEPVCTSTVPICTFWFKSVLFEKVPPQRQLQHVLVPLFLSVQLSIKETKLVVVVVFPFWRKMLLETRDAQILYFHRHRLFILISPDADIDRLVVILTFIN